MNRRDFLNPRRLARQTARILGHAGSLQQLEQDRPADAALLHFSRRAMATSFEVILPFGTPDATGVAGAALDLVDQLEDQLTVYRTHSEVSRLNATARYAPMAVEPHLFDLLVLAQQLHSRDRRRSSTSPLKL